MSVEKRTSVANETGKMGAGVYLAKIIGFLDPSFMAGIEVTLLREQGNDIGDLGQTYTVKYSSPFYGVTAFEYMGLNETDYNDTQKSYGIWFPPFEIGTTVMLLFVDGNPAEGYIIGCVPGRFMNQMIPAIGASTAVTLSAEDKTKYDTSQPLPVAEANRKANDLEKNDKIDKVKKAVHPIADAFLRQGLLEDDARGATTSSSRRNVPNMVFGISTPGPLDRRDGAKKQFIGSRQASSPTAVPVSRLGGSTLVFDDGDDRYQRKKSAGEGPVEYADVQAGEKGEPDIPYNEYVRLRTRTGHQILLHNSEDLIYIGNSRGTSWIELTSNGKIDIYAEDSISIHTEQDLNIRADRDINMEAGRNVNIKAVDGNFYAEAGSNYQLFAGVNGQLTALAVTNIVSGASHLETSPIIHMNGPPAVPVVPLSTHDNPVTSSQQPWAKKRYRVDDPLKSIMKRIPMHEPWILHENQAPKELTPDNTDRDS